MFDNESATPLVDEAQINKTDGERTISSVSHLENAEKQNDVI